ncbi:MAG: carboxymuconolactone decarboxylase family protein, partial [Gemmatimonadaceae bacterium]
MIPHDAQTGARLLHLDEGTRALVRLSAALAGGAEEQVRDQLGAAATRAPHEWIEEVLLQTYLFAGFPRALNGMREWRRISGAGAAASPAVPATQQREAGERACALVYGSMYSRLRVNIRALHPLLDDWMIEEGYGKVLSRPALDLPRRELCIVAACAATGQDRQLQSHLHGCRNTGVARPVVTAALE